MPRCFPALVSVKILCVAAAALLVVQSNTAADEISFRQHIAPILLDNCLACHGPKKAEGNYRIDSFERLMKPGDSEMATFTAADLEHSEVFRRITAEDESERMPAESDPLSAEHVALFKQWIVQGAKYDAEDPQAPLPSIIPPPHHPPAPEAYPHPLPVTALAFSPDGQRLMVGGYHEITVWNPEDGQLVNRIGNVGQRVYAIRFDPAGQRMAVACGSPGRLGETRIFNVADGQLLAVWGTTSDVTLDVAFHPTANQLAIASADGVIRIYDTEQGTLLRSITSHSDWVTAVAWSGDGKRLASASRDKTVKVFDAEDGELQVSYSGHGEAVNGVVFHPNNEEVYSAAADRKIHRWKIADGSKSAEMSFGGPVHGLQIVGTHLYATSADKTVRRFDTADNKQLHSFAGHTDWSISLSVPAGAGRVAAGAFDGTVRIWNVEDGKLLTTFTAAPGLPSQ